MYYNKHGWFVGGIFSRACSICSKNGNIHENAPAHMHDVDDAHTIVFVYSRSLNGVDITIHRVYVLSVPTRVFRSAVFGTRIMGLNMQCGP